MLIEVMCFNCDPPHVNWHECDQCHSKLSGFLLPYLQVSFFDPNKKWEYCPICGTKLYEE